MARPTNDLAAVRRFYVDGLGLSELYAFVNHAGFDGLMLGYPQAPYHLEFTRQAGTTVLPAPTAENLLVFYLPQKDRWEAAVARMQAHGYPPVPAHNAYWDQQGITFEDSDGYRVVLQCGSWQL